MQSFAQRSVAQYDPILAQSAHGIILLCNVIRSCRLEKGKSMPIHEEILRDTIARHARGTRTATLIPGLELFRAQTPTMPIDCVYEPRLCIIVQGCKQVLLGKQIFEYDAKKFLIATVDLPVVGGVTEASPEYPYLSLSLSLDPARIAALLLEISTAPSGHGDPVGLVVSTLTDELLDPVGRLIALLDHPEDIPVLAPLIERELLYRLLQGEQGSLLRQIALADSYLSQIRRAVAWIRAHFAESFDIGKVAKIAGMSPSSFHRHFRAVTMMSPIQYRTRIRLQEARRRLMAVGYDSPSQFSREYRRMFGVPPARDAARIRSLGEAEISVLSEPP